MGLFDWLFSAFDSVPDDPVIINLKKKIDAAPGMKIGNYYSDSEKRESVNAMAKFMNQCIGDGADVVIVGKAINKDTAIVTASKGMIFSNYHNKIANNKGWLSADPYAITTESIGSSFGAANNVMRIGRTDNVFAYGFVMSIRATLWWEYTKWIYDDKLKVNNLFGVNVDEKYIVAPNKQGNVVYIDLSNLDRGTLLLLIGALSKYPNN